MKESRILRAIRLATGRLRAVRLFRNNVGVALYPDGSRVRYGLFPGSSDLIGWRTVTIRPQDVGKRVAQFVALEVKTPKGRQTDAQRLFLDVVGDAGGLAARVESAEQAAKLLEEPLEQ